MVVRIRKGEGVPNNTFDPYAVKPRGRGLSAPVKVGVGLYMT